MTADHETGYIEEPGANPEWTELTGAAGQLPMLSWNSGGHTNGLVPVYAKGAGSKELARLATGVDPVRGAYLDNTDLANLFLEDFWSGKDPGKAKGKDKGSDQPYRGER